MHTLLQSMYIIYKHGFQLAIFVSDTTLFTSQT